MAKQNWISYTVDEEATISEFFSYYKQLELLYITYYYYYLLSFMIYLAKLNVF